MLLLKDSQLLHKTFIGPCTPSTVSNRLSKWSAEPFQLASDPENIWTEPLTSWCQRILAVFGRKDRCSIYRVRLPLKSVSYCPFMSVPLVFPNLLFPFCVKSTLVASVIEFSFPQKKGSDSDSLNLQTGCLQSRQIVKLSSAHQIPHHNSKCSANQIEGN